METYKLVSNDELYHHGIFGQRWGVRNGPPYPLDDEDHSARERKAGWKASLNNSERSSNKKERVYSSSSKNKKTVSFKEAHRTGKDVKENYKKSSTMYTGNESIDPSTKKKIAAIGLTCAAIAGASFGIYAASKYDVVNKIKKLYSDKVISEIYDSIKNNNFHPKIKEIKELINNSIGENADFILQKGAKLHRIDSKSRDNYGPWTYAAYKLGDRLEYKATLQNFDKTGEQYDVAFKALNDLKAPSYKKAFQIYSEMLSESVESLKNVDPQIKKDFLNNSKNMKDSFEYLITSFYDKNNIRNKQYKDALLKNGYNAIIDFHDIIENKPGKPLIILDPDKNLQKTGEHLVKGYEKIFSGIAASVATNPGIIPLIATSVGLSAVTNILDDENKSKKE